MLFNDFLKSLPSLLKNSNSKRYVIGNSSADYDSIFGSLIYAFVMSYQMGVLYLPLIDCNKNDIPLRFDVNFIMNKYSINYKQLIYKSDINFEDKSNKFCLYDHNERANLEIEQIIDHHVFEPTINSPQIQNRIIYPAGSSLTLLYYMIQPQNLQQQKQELQNILKPFVKKFITKEMKMDPLILQIIRHGVIMDCFGFDPKQAERWTQADQYLVSQIQDEITFDLTYSALTDLKFQPSLNLAFTLQEHVRRDHKLYEYDMIGKVQYSIVCLDPDVFVKKYFDQLISFQVTSNVFIFMFIWIISERANQKEAQFGRQAIFIINQKLSKYQITQIKLEIQTKFKMMGMVQKGSFQKWQRWNDPSVTVSRKKVDKYLRQNSTQNIKKLLKSQQASL